MLWVFNVLRSFLEFWIMMRFGHYHASYMHACCLLWYSGLFWIVFTCRDTKFSCLRKSEWRKHWSLYSRPYLKAVHIPGWLCAQKLVFTLQVRVKVVIATSLVLDFQHKIKISLNTLYYIIVLILKEIHLLLFLLENIILWKIIYRFLRWTHWYSTF